MRSPPQSLSIGAIADRAGSLGRKRVFTSNDPEFCNKVNALLANKESPSLFIQQTVSNADEVVGTDIGEVLRGLIHLKLDITDVRTVVGAKIERFGGG
jgi:hypothetical protein